MCHEKLYQSDATSQTEEVLANIPVEIVPEEADENAHVMNGLEDINQNYLDDSDDYIDLTDSEVDDLEE